MYLLDTSAILAHYLSEPGATEVQEILAAKEGYIAAVTWFELQEKLKNETLPQEVLAVYARAVAGIVDITLEVADAAFELRKAASARIPAADALIAGAARVRGYELVHRDAHLASIPTALLKQRMLASKKRR